MQAQVQGARKQVLHESLHSQDALAAQCALLEAQASAAAQQDRERVASRRAEVEAREEERKAREETALEMEKAIRQATEAEAMVALLRQRHLRALEVPEGGLIKGYGSLSRSIRVQE